MIPPSDSSMRVLLDLHRDRIPKGEHVRIQARIHNVDDAWTVTLWRAKGYGPEMVYRAHCVDIPATANRPSCAHGRLRDTCIRCDPWLRGDESEEDLDRWQAWIDAQPRGPLRIEIRPGVTLSYRR